MGEYEPNDSRNITLSNDNAPGEPPRTGPREGETRPGSQKDDVGEQGVRAAPQPGTPADTTINESRGGPINADLVQPGGTPQASQSQFQGGMTQSMGGMTQSLGGSNPTLQEPSAGHHSDARPEQLDSAQPSTSAPTQRESASPASEGAGWAADFPPSGSDANSASAIQHPQDMHEGDPDAERRRRQQAAGQDSQDTPQGFGYGAEEGEEMSDAPDVSDPGERGYGGGGEARIDKLNRDR